MKKLSKIAAVAMFGFAALASNVASAGSATGTFNVNINLTAACTLAAMTGPTLSYTSFQTTVASGTVAASATCTNNLPYSLALDSTSVTDTDTGIAYTITGVPASSLTGNGLAQAFTMTVSAAAGQAGTCGTGACTNTMLNTNNLRTLTVSW